MWTTSDKIVNVFRNDRRSENVVGGNNVDVFVCGVCLYVSVPEPRARNNTC